jgi:hypothetical protein
MVQDVAIYTDYKLDESYTPTRISVRVGTNFNDLQEIEVHASVARIRMFWIWIGSGFCWGFFEILLGVF